MRDSASHRPTWEHPYSICIQCRRRARLGTLGVHSGQMSECVGWAGITTPHAHPPTTSLCPTPLAHTLHCHFPSTALDSESQRLSRAGTAWKWPSQSAKVPGPLAATHFNWRTGRGGSLHGKSTVAFFPCRPVLPLPPTRLGQVGSMVAYTIPLVPYFQPIFLARISSPSTTLPNSPRPVCVPLLPPSRRLLDGTGDAVSYPNNQPRRRR
jgi:hypothetical protein